MLRPVRHSPDSSDCLALAMAADAHSPETRVQPANSRNSTSQAPEIQTHIIIPSIKTWLNGCTSTGQREL